jgi:hypothetical protein
MLVFQELDCPSSEWRIDFFIFSRLPMSMAAQILRIWCIHSPRLLECVLSFILFVMILSWSLSHWFKFLAWCVLRACKIYLFTETEDEGPTILIINSALFAAILMQTINFKHNIDVITSFKHNLRIQRHIFRDQFIDGLVTVYVYLKVFGKVALIES